MNNENEQPANSWDDDETETPFHNPYLNTARQNRPQPRAGETGRRVRPRGVPGSAHFYEEIESDEQAARPRPTRQSREEVEARLRQRSRQSGSARDQAELRARSAEQARKPSPRPAPRNSEDARYPYQPSADRQPRSTRDFSAGERARPTRDFSSEPPRTTRDFATGTPRSTHDFSAGRPTQRVGGAGDDYDDYDEIGIIEEPRPPRKHHPKRRRGGVFSTLLTGCLGGVIALIVVAGVLVFLAIHNTPLGQNLGVGKSTFNQPGQQALTLGSATQLIVNDQAGNVIVNVDPNASAAALSSVRHVQASGQSDANTQFKQIVLSIKPLAQGADPACLASSCLLVSAVMPSSGSGLLGGSDGASIDLTITLPASFNSPDPSTPDIITANANAGNISVSGFNGVLNLNGKAGNIAVTHTLIFASTCIQTLHGDITVAQESIFDLTSSSKLIPCSNTASTDPHRPWFNIKSGVGNVTI
ncbi:MAG TPA: hypothetical protein VN729_08540, partial [Ktedonobacteraceae bacterium]|nr:hypothetical protein [Ktedonobacteraceae bacterium]